MGKPTLVFSGRFDPVHPGHLATVIRLSQNYKVKVIILDSEERDYPITYIADIFLEILGHLDIQVLANKTHFGEITKEEWETFGATHYSAGNLKVLRHMEKLGAECVYMDRSFDYNASDYKRLE